MGKLNDIKVEDVRENPDIYTRSDTNWIIFIVDIQKNIHIDNVDNVVDRKDDIYVEKVKDDFEDVKELDDLVVDNVVKKEEIVSETSDFIVLDVFKIRIGKVVDHLIYHFSDVYDTKVGLIKETTKDLSEDNVQIIVEDVIVGNEGKLNVVDDFN